MSSPYDQICQLVKTFRPLRRTHLHTPTVVLVEAFGQRLRAAGTPFCILEKGPSLSCRLNNNQKSFLCRLATDKCV